jgi:hypothetical protein
MKELFYTWDGDAKKCGIHPAFAIPLINAGRRRNAECGMIKISSEFGVRSLENSGLEAALEQFREIVTDLDRGK